MPARKEAVLAFFEIHFAIGYIQLQFVIILDIKLLQSWYVEQVVEGDEYLEGTFFILREGYYYLEEDEYLEGNLTSVLCYYKGVLYISR
jgi:hypothetical protein